MSKQESTSKSTIRTNADLLHQDTQRLNQLNEMSRALVRAATDTELYNIAINLIPSIMTADRVSIVLFERDLDRAEIVAAGGRLSNPDKLIGSRWIRQFFDSDQEASEETYYYVPDLTQSNLEFSKKLSTNGLRSWLSVPLLIGKNVFGKLNVASANLDDYEEQDARVLIQIASILAPMLQSHQLLQSAQHRAAELEKTEQELTKLREQEELLYLTQVALNSTPQAIFWVNRRGDIMNASQGACKMFGYSLAEFRGMSAKVIDPTFAPPSKEIWEAFREQEFRIRECVFFTKDGREIPVELQLSYMAHGEHEFKLAIVNDITKRRKMEAQLRRKLKEEELLRSVLALTADQDDFLSIMGQICERMAEFYGCPRIGFFLWNGEQTHSRLVAEYTTPEIPSSIGRRVPINDSPLMQHLLDTRDVVVLHNKERNSINAPHSLEQMIKLDIETMLVVPIFIKEKLVGTLAIDTGIELDPSPQDIGLAKEVASQISNALNRVQLLEQLTQTSKALENSQKNLSEALGKLLMPICIVNKEGTYIYVNDAFGRMLGTTAKYVVGNMAAPDIYVTNSDRQDLLELLERDGEAVDFRVQFKQVTGRSFFAATSVYPLLYFGEPVLLSSVYDLTEQMRTEQVLREAKEEAEAANRTKSLFLSNMTHELRTPMNGVLGMTSLLLDTHLNEEQLSIVNTIRSSGDMLLTIINDVLDFSKIEANKLELEEVDFEVAAALEECLQLVRPSIEAKGIALTIQIEPTVPHWISQDVTRVRQILTNLLTNATKFTAQGEISIHVSTYVSTQPPAAQEDNHSIVLHFSVKDTGIGIPPKDRDSLFKPFSQIDASMNRRYGGTGLGLVISKQLCELMGGDIWVDSKVGQGSTFCFTIRAKAVAAAHRMPSLASNKPSPISSAPQEKSYIKSEAASEVKSETDSEKKQSTGADMATAYPLTILLAEDNAVNQKVALGILRKFGYGADVAANGVEVLDALQRQKYDVVLMDIQMPEMDGITATKRIRTDWPEHEQPIIIALTANAMKQQMQQYLASGMDDFVSKPIRLPKLADALKRAAKHQPRPLAGNPEHSVS